MTLKSITYITVTVWLILFITFSLKNRPSSTMLCDNFCLPQRGSVVEKYEPTNGMEYQQLKYCMCK